MSIAEWPGRTTRCTIINWMNVPNDLSEDVLSDEAQTVQVSVGKDRWFKLSGQLSFLTALVIVLMIVVGYLINFNLKSWGEPFSIKETFIEHTTKVTQQHDDITLALRWNTFVQWACSPNNISNGAKQKCSEIDLMRPEPEEQVKRRYRIPHD